MERFITRTEIQKVFDETAGVIQAQQQTLQRMDMVISCIAEKVGLTAQDVNEWVAKKVAEAAEKAKAAEPEKTLVEA